MLVDLVVTLLNVDDDVERTKETTIRVVVKPRFQRQYDTTSGV